MCQLGVGSIRPVILKWLDLPFMSPIRNLAGTPMCQLGGYSAGRVIGRRGGNRGAEGDTGVCWRGGTRGEQWLQDHIPKEKSKHKNTVFHGLLVLFLNFFCQAQKYTLNWKWQIGLKGEENVWEGTLLIRIVFLRFWDFNDSCRTKKKRGET